MNTLSLTAKAVRSSFIVAAASSVAFSGLAFAEEQQEGAKVERIEVTGSRIQRTDMETASPVTVIDASAIKAAGATSIDEVLQKMTATGGAMTNPGINNGSQGNASINLRGLGSQRTLVLVNNRRMVNSGTGAASTVDLNTIPVSMIKRIEVLKDGASSVYGSDAVAGVVNIILKDDFEGLEANVQTGISGQGDANETSFDLTMGEALSAVMLLWAYSTWIVVKQVWLIGIQRSVIMLNVQALMVILNSTVEVAHILQADTSGAPMDVTLCKETLTAAGMNLPMMTSIIIMHQATYIHQCSALT